MEGQRRREKDGRDEGKYEGRVGESEDEDDDDDDEGEEDDDEEVGDDNN
jgi:hypothetical protein